MRTSTPISASFVGGTMDGQIQEFPQALNYILVPVPIRARWVEGPGDPASIQPPHQVYVLKQEYLRDFDGNPILGTLMWVYILQGHQYPEVASRKD